jgi:hypothetical protein
MGILSTVGGFFGGLNWIRIALIAALAATIFGMGYMYAGKKHAEHEADVQKAITEAVAEKEKELRREYEARLEEESLARAALFTDLEAIRDHRDSLIDGIRRAQLTKPVSEVRVEACLEGDDDVQVVIANPFSDDFVRLWNDGSRGRLSGADPGTETD